MIGIVIVAHGALAQEYLRAVEHVVGKQDAVRTIQIGYDHDRQAKEREICEAADAVDRGDGVVVVVDMFGGSPSNLSLAACNPANRMILYGANLPLLVKLAKSRTKPLKAAVLFARDAGRKYIDARAVGANESLL
ncbi:PTS sugar transporter subunit IIA [Nereida sp. MMG025]|uniref:PTS sugar transporter subunit IIA n=1 Tax=Nereida sp. MMG025 TaxID=2909981 RepID=UPI001F1C0DD9|nr:PTS fructose transporter subunit IIA [Nereida sp. MMG025]MCF6445947.1 PTS fructose transporter subunit IIA [Nereida sp. MMG025]